MPDERIYLPLGEYGKTRHMFRLIGLQHNAHHRCGFPGNTNLTVQLGEVRGGRIVLGWAEFDSKLTIEQRGGYQSNFVGLGVIPRSITIVSSEALMALSGSIRDME